MVNFKEIRKHYGSFSLDARSMANHPDFWARVMCNVLVTRCENLFQENCFLYNGFSMLFSPIEEGEKPLFYKFEIDEFNDIVAINTNELEITNLKKIRNVGGQWESFV